MKLDPEAAPEEGGRISLRKVDRLLQGDLPEAEAAALRREISASPEASRYLERQSALRSGLSWDRVSRLSGFPKASSASAWERFLGTFAPGTRGIGMAMACAMLVGIGVWTWRSQEPGMPDAETVEGRQLRSKGIEEVRIRLLILGKALEPGEVASAGNGDTMGVSYRGPGPVSTQIWYQEEDGDPRSMTGAAEDLAWPPAAGWRAAPVRIVLEGSWTRQTIWVVTSLSPFSAAEAVQSIGGAGKRADMRADAFRLVKPR